MLTCVYAQKMMCTTYFKICLSFACTYKHIHISQQFNIKDIAHINSTNNDSVPTFSQNEMKDKYINQRYCSTPFIRYIAYEIVIHLKNKYPFHYIIITLDMYISIYNLFARIVGEKKKKKDFIAIIS